MGRTGDTLPSVAYNWNLTPFHLVSNETMDQVGANDIPTSGFRHLVAYVSPIPRVFDTGDNAFRTYSG